MAQVIAITRIEHGQGEDGIKVFDIGDELGSLSEDEQRTMVLGGSAVEVGKGRKFTPEPADRAEDDTVKRDALIAKALTGLGENEYPSPAAVLAEQSGTVKAETSGPNVSNDGPSDSERMPKMKPGTTKSAGSA